MSGPLDGVRVIDQTSVVVGPICTRTLADQGAEVIKIEPPGGDLLRTLAHGARHPGMSGKFLNFNRNKRSVCLDVKHHEGLAALRSLIAGADVFVSNVRPSALARAGLDHASLLPANPRLIHCPILALGRGGRYRGIRRGVSPQQRPPRARLRAAARHRTPVRHQARGDPDAGEPVL